MTTRASGADTRIAFIKETTVGTTPTTPAFQNARATSESLNETRNKLKSSELHPLRTVASEVTGAADVGGSFSFEFSHNTFDAMLEAIMYGTWTANELFVDNTINAYTFEVTHAPGVIDAFRRYTGMHASKFSLNMKPNEIVTGDIEFMGLGFATDTAIIAGATYTDAGSETIMTGKDFIWLPTAATVFADIECIPALTLEINNSLRAQHCLGDIQPDGIGLGEFDVSGTIEFYVDADVLPVIAAYAADTTIPLTWTLGNTANEKYEFHVPSCSLSGMQIATEGKDQDVLVKFNWRGLRDTTIGDSSIRITRNVA